MKKSKIVVIALSTAILSAGPGWGQSVGWMRERDKLLGPDRDGLMTACGYGKELNSMGKSYWVYSFEESRKTDALAGGHSSAAYDSFSAGMVAAMKQACPTVW